MPSALWFVYIIESSDGFLYTGITTDVERRFREHQGLGGKNKGAKFFRGRQPRALVYIEEHESRSAASQREAQIKRMNASAKQKMIQKTSMAFDTDGENLGWASGIRSTK